MNIEELDYPFPIELIADRPYYPKRIMWVDRSELNDSPMELIKEELLSRIPSGDLFICNNTKVIKCRVFTQDGIEILFLNHFPNNEWEVLFPAKKFKLGSKLILPGGLELELLQKGRPQRVRASFYLKPEYFDQYGEMPLPPYIQQVRTDRHAKEDDNKWYQTAWAANEGSFAAPTASLHFDNQDLECLRQKGIEVLFITLHVGLGTFLPIKVSDLNEHEMHSEWTEVSAEVWEKIGQAKKEGHKIWALGTTVTRALESAAKGYFDRDVEGNFRGTTNIFIKPPFEFEIVDRLLTNFHLPKSTLLALVGAFAGLERVKASYQWAIEKKFKLFSYGDLSVWLK